jgi:hypothetical protein
MSAADSAFALKVLEEVFSSVASVSLKLTRTRSDTAAPAFVVVMCPGY